jgi:hypothetical protein
MRFLTVVAAAASLAPLSQALLPPPSLSQEILSALPPGGDFGINARVIELPCPSCRVGPSIPLRDLPLDHEPRPGETFPASVLRLNVSIHHHGLTDQLLMNDCVFYPLPSPCTTIWTDQFVKSPCVNHWEYAASPEAAFRLTMHYLDDNVAGLGIKLQMLQLFIGRLGSKLLIGQEPEISVKLLIFPTGTLMISTDPARVPTGGPPPDPHCFPFAHHDDRSWFSLCMGLVRAFVLHAVIPVVIGLVVAVAAFYIWRKRFLRRQRLTYCGVHQDVASKSEDKSQRYVDHPDAPLLDEDAPPYEEVAS